MECVCVDALTDPNRNPGPKCRCLAEYDTSLLRRSAQDQRPYIRRFRKESRTEVLHTVSGTKGVLEGAGLFALRNRLI